MSYYKVPFTSRRYYMKVFWHVQEMLIVNASVLYNLSVDASERLSGFEFRKKLAKELIGDRIYRQAGPQGGAPVKMPRTDQSVHCPVMIEEGEQRGLCHTGCKSETNNKRLQCNVKCEMCGLFFCFNKERNCFRDHVRKMATTKSIDGYMGDDEE
jgi:hypothetical protein